MKKYQLRTANLFLMVGVALILGLASSGVHAQSKSTQSKDGEATTAKKAATTKAATAKATSAKVTAAKAESDSSAKAGAKKTAAKKPAGRLPAYYSAVVDDKQRVKIYQIQAEHEKQIDALKEQLRDLVAERDAEIRDVLSPAQQKELDEIIAKSRESRRKAAASVASSKKD